MSIFCYNFDTLAQLSIINAKAAEEFEDMEQLR
jgi:hypothetical protein